MQREKSNLNVDEIANLAKLQIDEATKEKLRVNMAEIVNYVEKISKLDLKAVQPVYYHSNAKNVYREDLVELFLEQDKILAIAPETRGEFIKVPPVLPEEEQ